MINLTVHESAKDVDFFSWKKLVKKQNPFLTPEFFHSLETSNCLGPERGWRPLYFCAYEEQFLKAMAVVFVKSDSFGEFIFDWAWAQAYQQHGLSYYPKLTFASPFSPVSAPKLLGDPDIISEKLLPKIWDVYQNSSVSGLHALFVQPEEKKAFESLGMLERDSFQYHWKKGEAKSFDDFLTRLKRSRRKNILKERRRVLEAGISIRKIMGSEIQENEIDFFYECYINTIAKKWSQAYLTRLFFQQMVQQMPERIVLLVAEKDGERVASAFYLYSQETLYGRYWGCLRRFDSLHFELCLYRGIELCFELGLESFEAGAQGEHKRMRGFVPVLTKSYHHLKHPQFHDAVAGFIESERTEIQSLFQEFESSSAYKGQAK